MSLAKAFDFEFRLIFVMSSSPELNVERVRLRVEKGGHAVPEMKINERWMKSLGQLPWFLAQADQAAIFDNSGSMPRLVGRKLGGQIAVAPDAPARLREALGLNVRTDNP